MSIIADIKKVLEDIHNEMFQKAQAARKEHIKDVDNWQDFMIAISGRNLCMAPWCNI